MSSEKKQLLFLPCLISAIYTSYFVSNIHPQFYRIKKGSFLDWYILKKNVIKGGKKQITEPDKSLKRKKKLNNLYNYTPTFAF